MENLTEMNLNIQKIAINTEQIGKDLANQSKILTKQDERLNNLESRPADAWKNLQKTAFSTVVSAVFGGLITVIAALMIFGVKNLM